MQLNPSTVIAFSALRNLGVWVSWNSFQTF